MVQSHLGAMAPAERETLVTEVNSVCIDMLNMKSYADWECSYGDDVARNMLLFHIATNGTLLGKCMRWKG
jgi:hypothetical protein